MIKFVDFFAGIGGFRLALEDLDWRCVLSCEKDKYARKVYEDNFSKVEIEDICTLTKEDILNFPSYDVFVGGFPCQPFSVCGNREGFSNKTKGTLFFNILHILSLTKPKAVFLENVFNLETHDNGITMQVIKNSLVELGYSVSYSVLNSSNFGVPQNRNRIYIVALRNDISNEFMFENLSRCEDIKLINILEDNDEYLNNTEYTLIEQTNKTKNGLIFAGYRNKQIRKKGVNVDNLNLSRIHKQPNRIYSASGIHPCLCAGEMSGRYFIEINGQVRKLTLLECFRLQGFPDEFIKAMSKSQLYKQIGNSVSVPVIKEIGKELERVLTNSSKN